MNSLFNEFSDPARVSTDSNPGKPENFYAFNIPEDSPFAIAIAHHAARGEAQKISKLKEYLTLRHQRDQGEDYNVVRLGELQEDISKEYLVHTDAQLYLGETWGKTDAGRDFNNRFQALKAYLSQFSGESGGETLKIVMDHANEANRRRRGYAKKLQQDVRNRKKVWKIEEKKWEGAEYLERNFPDMLQRSLDVTIGRINTAIRMGNEMANGQSPLSEEYIKSMQQINHFLDTFNEREEISIVDLMYYIGEHRDATTFRSSTGKYYSEYEALVAGLSHSMPSHERQREDVDLVHNCVDQEFNDLTHAMKLSYLNVKHNIGLTSQEIDIYSAVTSTVSNVMRAYGISEIDDRTKQQYSNSGDHSLRTILTVVSIRDANIARFERLFATGKINEEQLQRQKDLANEAATYMCKMACLHDSGEYLGELLGNNLVGKSVLEERFLRILRDQTETHIMQNIVPDELHYRLNQGRSAERWLGLDVKEYIKSSLHPSGGFDFDTQFYDTVFDIFERLQTNHDIISLRDVGRINHEGNYENARNASAEDVRYTMQYVYSKITGHKFTTNDPAEIADFYKSEYYRERARKDYEISNKVAADTGAPLPHDPDITRIQDLPNSSLPMDMFMEEKEIDFNKSIFKQFVDQTKSNYENLPEAEARARQAHDEALLHGLCYEMNHYARKLAKSSNLDRLKVDKATRKSIAQGILAAHNELKKHGIELQYLELPDQILDKKRYRVASVNTSTFMGGFLGDPNKPNQLFEPLQGIVNGIETVIQTTQSKVLSPLWKIAKTPVQGMTLIDLDHVTEDDFKRLFQISSVLEAGGDLSLGTIGLTQSAVTPETGFDPKSLAVLNPLLTFILAGPQRHAEAIEKCYGHVLHLYSDQIAKKYGLEDTIDFLKTRENLKKGPFNRKPTDITLSGELAEKMYGYFEAQYKDGVSTEIHPGDEKSQSKAIEKAEKYILREMIYYQITKTTNRLLQESSSAQRSAWEERLKTLKAALKKPELSGNKVFRALAKHNMELRFGSIGILGALMAGSSTGADIGQLPLIGKITTSTLFGLNLAFAGFSGMLASVSDRLKKIPHSDFINRLDNLPHFEHGKDGGLYIVKGASHKLKGSGYKDTEKLIQDMIKERERSPNIAVQFFDMVIAVPVSAIRALSNRSASSTAFENQNMAQTVDSMGVIKKAFTETTGVMNAGIQSAAAVSASMFFRRVGVLNMFMHEIREDIQNGKDPDFKIIRERIRDKLRDNANANFLNVMKNIGRANTNTSIGYLGLMLERVMYNDLTSKTAHKILNWQHGVTPQEQQKHEPE